jgi:hypothetical protein
VKIEFVAGTMCDEYYEISEIVGVSPLSSGEFVFEVV